MCYDLITKGLTHIYCVSEETKGWEDRKNFRGKKILFSLFYKTYTFTYLKLSWALWLMPLIRALMRYRQVHLCDVRMVRATQGDLASK